MGGSNDAHGSSPSDVSQLAIDPSRETSPEHHDAQSKDNVSPPGQAEDLKAFILSFLATSGPRSLACVLVGLIIATYIVLGRLGLLLIGLVLGIVLHASWEDTSGESRPEVLGGRGPRRRKELALELASRLLDMPKRKSTEADNEVGDREKAVKGKLSKDLEYSAFGPKTSVALRSLTDATIRDYVM